jgi:hypothetical protein
MSLYVLSMGNPWKGLSLIGPVTLRQAEYIIGKEPDLYAVELLNPDHEQLPGDPDGEYAAVYGDAFHGMTVFGPILHPDDILEYPDRVGPWTCTYLRAPHDVLGFDIPS